MAIRIGPGPVFVFEARAVARKPWGYAARAAAALVLLPIFLVGAVFTAYLLPRNPAASPLGTMRWLGMASYKVLAWTELMLALFVAPAVAADALGRDRTRGALGHLLVSDLSAAEIVVGTVAGRLGPILAMLIAALPVMMLSAAWFGTDPGAIVMLGMIALGTALLGASAAAAMSLWTRRTYEALLGAWILWGLWMVIVLVCGRGAIISARLAVASNPISLAMAAYDSPGSFAPVDALRYLGATAALSVTVLAFTTFRLRAAALRGPARRPAESRSRRRLLAWLPGPSLDGNPILWREWWHARRSRGGRFFWALYAFLTVALAAFNFYNFWTVPQEQDRPSLILNASMVMALGLLAVAVGAAGAWSEERAAGQGGLDVLLSTPLSASTIVRGKWWAAYRPVLFLAIVPVLVTLFLVAVAPAWPHVNIRFYPPRVIRPLRLIDRIGVASVVIAQVFLDGAFLVSLGLWLATRFRRPVFAVVGTVVVFVTFTAVVPTVVEIYLFPHFERKYVDGLGTVSPIGGPIITLAGMFSGYYGSPRHVVPVSAAWLVLAAVGALLLRSTTIRTFDRRMGRMKADDEAADEPVRQEDPAPDNSSAYLAPPRLPSTSDSALGPA